MGDRISTASAGPNRGGVGVQGISLFETNIRVVGGLVAAYDLSGDKVFMDKAVELVDLMLPSMNGSSTGTSAANHQAAV